MYVGDCECSSVCETVSECMCHMHGAKPAVLSIYCEVFTVLFIFVFPPFKFLIFLLHCNLLGFCVCVGKAIVCEHLLLEKQQGFICLSLSLSHVAAPTPLKHYFFVNFLINAAFVCLLSLFF